MDKVEVVKFIKTTLSRKGDGTEGSPIRIIEQYWDFDGNLVFEYDPHKETIVSNTMKVKNHNSK